MYIACSSHDASCRNHLQGRLVKVAVVSISGYCVMLSFSLNSAACLCRGPIGLTHTVERPLLARSLGSPGLNLGTTRAGGCTTCGDHWRADRRAHEPQTIFDPYQYASYLPWCIASDSILHRHHGAWPKAMHHGAVCTMVHHPNGAPHHDAWPKAMHHGAW